MFEKMIPFIQYTVHGFAWGTLVIGLLHMAPIQTTPLEIPLLDGTAKWIELPQIQGVWGCLVYIDRGTKGPEWFSTSTLSATNHYMLIYAYIPIFCCCDPSGACPEGARWSLSWTARLEMSEITIVWGLGQKKIVGRALRTLDMQWKI